ncbi:MAG TPA: nitronate monooxygenase, partial [Burkholderiaceae bacterium]|nr:nitronate monooxygenase [Burkholderiaceae bacterium]
SLRRVGYDPENMPEKPQRNYDSSQQQQVEAKRWKDVWSAGQGIGAIRAIEPMSAVVDRLAREYDAGLSRVAALIAGR